MTTRTFGMGGMLAAVCALGVVTAAEAQNARERQMMADIRMLQEQAQQLQLQLLEAVETLSQSLRIISTRIDEQNNATRKAFADQKLTVDQLGSDLRIVRERVDESNVRIASMSQEIDALRASIAQAPSAAAPVDPWSDPSAASQSGLPPPDASPPVGGAGVSPQRTYDTAWADYSIGQWELCIEGFNTYLRSFPRSELADDAQYYIGECAYSAGDFTAAVEAYNRVITNYPKGDHVPLAYYKRGLVLDRIGQQDRARESWEALIKNFPDTDAARLAKQGLDRLNRGRPQ